METIEYVTRIKNLNHAERMVRLEKKHLIAEFINSLALFPGDLVYLKTSYRDNVPNGKYLIHNVSPSFNGEYLVLDVESEDCEYHTCQVPIENLDEKVKILQRNNQPMPE